MNSHSRPRILIAHQGCVPIYRKPFFDRLAKVKDFEYVVACGEPPRGTDYIVAEQPYGFETLAVTNKEVTFGKSSVIWQTLVRNFWRDFDAVILGDEAKYLSHFAIMVAAKMKRKPVMLWGFGFSSSFKNIRSTGLVRNLIRSLGHALRAMRVRFADGYLVYTKEGAVELAEAGFPLARIAIMQNTVDIEFQQILHDEIALEPEMESRRALGLPREGPILLYFGRFLPGKRVELLIDYVRHCREEGRCVSAIVFGAGVEHQKLLERAKGLDTVFFRTHDDRALARALRVSCATVIPGFVGLAITHSFAHGVPIITRDVKHAPEITCLSPEKNGLLLPPDIKAFFRGLDDYLANPNLQETLSEGARAAAKNLSLDASVFELNKLVRQTFNRPDVKQ